MLWLGLNWPSCCLFSIHPNCSFFLFLAQFWIVQVSYLSFPFIFIIGLLPICLCFIFFSSYFHVCNIHSQLILVYLQIVFITLCIASCSQSLQELPRYDLKKAPIHRGQGESEERNSPLQIGVWQFYWAKELTYEACLGWPQDKEFCTPACQILKVYIEVLTGISYIYHPDSLNTTFLSQGYILGAASGKGEGKWNTHSKDRGEVGSLRLLDFSSQDNRQSHLLNDIP